MSIDLLNSIHQIAARTRKREISKLLKDEDYEIMTLVDANTIIRIIQEAKQKQNGNKRKSTRNR